jgi:hypothetical protein
VQKQFIKIAIALFIVASLMLAFASAAAAHGMNGKGGHCEHGKMRDIDTVYHTIAVTDINDNSMTFSVLNSAIKGKDGNVTNKNFTTPKSIQYYFSNDTIVKPMRNKSGHKHQRPARTDYNSATINPAGASAILVMKNITMVKKENNTSEFQLSGFSAYLPDGTVKSYKFDAPVTVVKSWKDRTTKVTGNTQQQKADMKDALKGIAKFPANAAPLSLKSIDAKM